MKKKSKFWIHAAILGIAGFLLRAWSVREESPGFDEMMAMLIASDPFSQYTSHLKPDFCPPVFYALYHPVAFFGESVGYFRALSILIGTFTPIFLYAVGRKLLSETAALIAAWLLLLNPLHVFYSQEVQPAAPFILLSIITVYYMIRSAESNSLRDWAFYDILAIVLLHTKREAIFFVAILPLIQFTRVLFFPPQHQEKRISRGRLLQNILLNHFIVLAVSVPWLWIMPNKVPWPLPVPGIRDLLNVFVQYMPFGMITFSAIPVWAVTAALAILLLPPFLKSIHRIDFRTYVIFIVTFLAPLIPFLYSQAETPRFIASREAATAIPFICLALGILIARCNFVIKTALIIVFCGIFSFSSYRQAVSLQKTASTDMLNTIMKDNPPQDAIVAFWPDYTEEIGHFWERFYGQKHTYTTARNLLQHFANLSPGQTVYFVLSQFPSNTEHLYTFPGALHQFSQSSTLWKDGYNRVIKSTNLDQKTLDQWYKDPQTLKILDQPTTNTQFIFTPDHNVFKGNSFATDRLDLSYDSTGERVVWTTEGTIKMDLPVRLAPGAYDLRLHCSSHFEQPEFHRDIKRQVQIELRTAEARRKNTVSDKQIISVEFTTDTELESLPIQISVDPMLKLPYPSPGTYGIKIYSISIEQHGDSGEDSF